MLELLLALALREPTEPFDPVRHESQDGRWSLAIDPVERRGAGPADYRCIHAGEVAWQGRLPFALDELCITDDGFVVGCANTEGRDAWEGELLVVRITPAGVARVCAVAPKQSPEAVHGWSSPRVLAMQTFTDPPHFRVQFEEAPPQADAKFAKPVSRGRRQVTWSFTLPSGDVVSSAPREKSPWFEREWTPDPMDERPLVVPVAALEVSALSVLHAETLGDFRLATTVPANSGFVAVGRDGTIAVLDGRSGALALHDASGALRCSTTVGMERLRPDALDATRGGEWIVQGRSWAHLDRSGAIVEARPREGWRVRELPALGNESRRVWRLEEGGVELRDGAGATKRRIERAPDRRWFRALTELLVTPDGGAVVIEEGRGEPRIALHVFAPDGSLASSLALPETKWRPRASVAGSLVFVPTEHWDVLAIDSRTLQAWRVEIGARDTLLGCVALVTSPDGRELWRFSEGSAGVMRFALPAESR